MENVRDEKPLDDGRRWLLSSTREIERKAHGTPRPRRERNQVDEYRPYKRVAFVYGITGYLCIVQRQFDDVRGA
jgi:hypothetical protein